MTRYWGIRGVSIPAPEYCARSAVVNASDDEGVARSNLPANFSARPPIMT